MTSIILDTLTTSSNSFYTSLLSLASKFPYSWKENFEVVHCEELLSFYVGLGCKMLRQLN